MITEKGKEWILEDVRGGRVEIACPGCGQSIDFEREDRIESPGRIYCPHCQTMLDVEVRVAYRLVKTLLCLVALLAVAGQVQAAELLLEISQSRSYTRNDTRPPTINLVVAVAIPGGVADWIQTVSTTDVGTTWDLPVADFAPLTYGERTGLIYRCCEIGSFESNLNIESSGPISYGNITRHAPVIGPDLYGYALTSITETLDSFTLVQQWPSSTYKELSAKHTLRIYGDPVPGVPGDFNQDGSVDAADYVLYRDRYDTIGALPNGSGNSIVYDYDYAIWREKFGHEFSPVSSALGLGSQSVPEPTTWLLCLVSIAGIAALRLGRFGSCG